MSSKTRELYEFGPFRIDPYQRLLLRKNRAVRWWGLYVGSLLSATGCWHRRSRVERARVARGRVTEQGCFPIWPRPPSKASGPLGPGVRFVDPG